MRRVACPFFGSVAITPAASAPAPSRILWWSPPRTQPAQARASGTVGCGGATSTRRCLSRDPGVLALVVVHAAESTVHAGPSAYRAQVMSPLFAEAACLRRHVVPGSSLAWLAYLCVPAYLRGRQQLQTTLPNVSRIRERKVRPPWLRGCTQLPRGVPQAAPGAAARWRPEGWYRRGSGTLIESGRAS